MTRFVSLYYEVFGKVQGVWFRKYTKNKAIELNLVGYVKNTERGTVSGIAQGEREKIEIFKKWLQYEGSPSSRIDKTTLQEEEIETLEFYGFDIKR
ncbi:hypothetical protein RclHR1_02510008 [Rhizophagus clarus]|uniref:Acylphosphatase n=1 Tax=Rhizophagus clarus TaxID=94130 RepID=A0A2Z6RBL4_9GLOM|nr:hypothetical protein RclHR1_02510008 [Rhizophagus clarus]GES98630.1 acylphosphatase-2 isoform X1 [Rhizophagus clarus]